MTKNECQELLLGSLNQYYNNNKKNKELFNNIIQGINHLNEYQKKQLAIVLISQTLTSASFMDAINLSGIDLFDSIGKE